jgi:hypothetical protein
VRSIASIIAERELLHIRTATNDTYTITHRLQALEARLDPRRFVRLSRSAVANVEMIAQIMAVSASPTDRDVVWVGIEPSAVWRSEDPGITWVQTSPMETLSSSTWSCPPTPDIQSRKQRLRSAPARRAPGGGSAG